MEKVFDGTVRFPDLWIQVNEHRFFTSNLIVLPLARWTHWNQLAELVVIHAFATLVFAMLLSTVLRHRDSQTATTAGIVLLLGAFFFSYAQHNLWMWGLHVSIAVCMFFVAGSLRILSGGIEFSPARFALAALAGIAATYAFGTGTGVWPAGLVVIALRSERFEPKYFIGWLCVCAAALALYFLDFSGTPGIGAAIAAPHLVMAYAATYLGAPWFPYAAPLAIAGGLAFAAALAVCLRQEYGRPSAERLPWLPALALFAVIAATLTALKHYDEGLPHAASSRFLPWATLRWCALMAWCAARYELSRPYAKRLLLVLTAAAVAASSYGAYKADERHDAFILGREALLSGEDDGTLIYLHPDPNLVLENRKTLVTHRLSVFRGAIDSR